MRITGEDVTYSVLARLNLVGRRRSMMLDRDHSVFFSGVIMTTSKRLADRKIEKFDKNITKRGFVPETTTKKGKDYPVGPILLGFFVFVVIGSSLFQIIRTATSGGMA
ncbi:hypothetical protein YC2023_089966 [Brassica napus]